MKFKRFIFIGIVLGAGLFSFSIAGQQRGKTFFEGLRSPSPDQVKIWAGFPESARLTMSTNVPTDGGYDQQFGNFKWLWVYDDRKGSNYARVVIAVYEPGGFWPAKCAEAIKLSEQMYKTYLDQKRLGNDAIFFWELSPMTMPNGQKSYGCLNGLSPMRFALHPQFDVLALEYARPESDGIGILPAYLPEMATNYFSKFFTNVDAFLTSQ